MWGGRDPSQEEADQLGACFEWEWMQAIESSKSNVSVTICSLPYTLLWILSVKQKRKGGKQ
jgi:hypothetical protein